MKRILSFAITLMLFTNYALADLSENRVKALQQVFRITGKTLDKLAEESAIPKLMKADAKAIACTVLDGLIQDIELKGRVPSTGEIVTVKKDMFQLLADATSGNAAEALNLISDIKVIVHKRLCPLGKADEIIID